MNHIPHHLADEIARRRSATMVGWDGFREDVSPFQVAEVIDRSKTKFTDDFVPWAPGIAVASDYLLRAANYDPGSRRPPGWTQHSARLFRKLLHRNYLTVSRCGEFWLVERQIEEVLVYRYGSLPIVTRNYQAAMRLAEYCHLPRNGEFHRGRPRGVASNLKWVVSTPDGVWCLARM
jgi:hypothetical protein